MKLNVNLDSYTLCGSGEGAGLIDSDVMFDDFGIPYLPGRRIKGLLRESAHEVLEMLGKIHLINTLLHSLFGNGGFEPGHIRIPNLHFPDYDNTIAYIEALLKDPDMSMVTGSRIILGFTEIREQTAIDTYGIADENSLRICRVLRPGLSFETRISELSDSETALLFLAVHNLKRMGASRNRGQGKITCKLTETIFDSEGQSASDIVNQAIAHLERPAPSCIHEKSVHVDKPVTPAGGMKRVRYTVTLRSPLLISRPIGDENTVATSNYLPGNVIRGVLAARIMAQRGLSTDDAHQDDIFHALLLSGDKPLSITPAFPCLNGAAFCHTPMSLYTDKAGGDVLFNLADAGNVGKDAKYRREMMAFTNDGVVTHGVNKTLYFHTTRGDRRVQGKSDEGGIFFYEAIDSRQQFTGWLWGEDSTLKMLVDLAGDRFDAQIGRSRSAQYGDVCIEIAPACDNEPSGDIYGGYGGESEFLLNVLSPVIFYNDSGMSEIGTEQLTSWLAGFFECDVTIINAFARMTMVENFVGVWGMKTQRDMAYEEGSTFAVRIAGLDAESRRQKVADLMAQGLGERTDAGFGRVRVLTLDHSEYRKKRSCASYDYPGTMPETVREILKNVVRDEIRQRVVEAGIRHAAEYTCPLSNHQIGRLEQMLTELDRRAFLEALDSLRETAKKQMETCRNRHRESILDSLKKYDQETASEIHNALSGAQKILDKAKLEKNEILDRDLLSRDYWISLLRKMRKDNKVRRS